MRGDQAVALIQLLNSFKTACWMQVQTQLGPEVQEIGGFWLSAVSALANGMVTASGWATRLSKSNDFVIADDSATV